MKTTTKNSRVVSVALQTDRLWQDALLPEGGRASLAEPCLYCVLASTVVSSLLMAFWQLRTFDASWASFVELVGRVVS